MKALMLAALEKTLTESTTQSISNIKDGYIPKQDKTSTSQKFNIFTKNGHVSMFKAGVIFFKAHHFDFFEPLVFGVFFCKMQLQHSLMYRLFYGFFLSWMLLGGGFNPFEKH